MSNLVTARIALRVVADELREKKQHAMARRLDKIVEDHMHRMPKLHGLTPKKKFPVKLKLKLKTSTKPGTKAKSK